MPKKQLPKKQNIFDIDDDDENENEDERIYKMNSKCNLIIINI
jgi:hypothetical protein